jgi:hypothetical protein
MRHWWSWLWGGTHYEFGCWSQISEEFTLGLYVLRASDVAVDLKHRVLALDEEVSLQCPGARLLLFLRTIPSNEVMSARRGRVVTAWLKDLLEAVSRLAGPSLKAAHERVYRGRTVVQLWREIPIMMSEHKQGQKRTNGDEHSTRHYVEFSAQIRTF